MTPSYLSAREEFEAVCDKHEVSEEDLGMLAIIFLTETNNAEAFRGWLDRVARAGGAQDLLYKKTLREIESSPKLGG